MTDAEEAFRRLQGLRKNVPEYDIPREFIEEYTRILSQYEKATGRDLTDYRIPNNMIKPNIVGADEEGNFRYSRDLFCEHDFFLMKLDGLLLTPPEIKPSARVTTPIDTVERICRRFRDVVHELQERSQKREPLVLTPALFETESKETSRVL